MVHGFRIRWFVGFVAFHPRWVKGFAIFYYAPANHVQECHNEGTTWLGSSESLQGFSRYPWTFSWHEVWNETVATLTLMALGHLGYDLAEGNPPSSYGSTSLVDAIPSILVGAWAMKREYFTCMQPVMANQCPGDHQGIPRSL